MTSPQWETTAAWQELLAGLGELDGTFLDGARAVQGGQAVAEGYRGILTALGIALDTYLFADAARPMLIDLTTPFRRDRRWGGDNTDAWYCFTPIDSARTYRVSGDRGDSDYFSFTIYDQPEPGAWATRIVALLNDTDLDIDADGRFSFVMGPFRPDGYDGHFLELEADAAIALTRDYQVDARTGRRVVWEIEALHEPGPLARSDEETAAALRAALKWVQMLFNIVPLSFAPKPATAVGHITPTALNEFAEPYQVGDVTYGWAARDACYAYAAFSLGPDEALVITHRPPRCRFWNLVVWNPFMATESLTDARMSVNHGSAVPNADGTVTVVLSDDELAHPNAITTAGHAEGTLAFRWFLADAVPERPVVELVKTGDAPTAPT